ncbi:MAG: hypothetical protein UX97_C0001G0219 [Candidatus Beckwithbacteria bacterium GW2011_GWA2_47_25]|nr:hypothetical protein [uncultured bacterium]KKU34880.1 MAG: hypothetical protein UX50_C0009G0007 [Candidatus Beckwithbacteria bacterium GW2011_GWA1_46_30]KKU72349.1 MAG: hypothetical protein UX97_C0001G0219 [Candidatus Beckwithbacteria bacterium GW2011_GWA2_47_25]
MIRSKSAWELLRRKSGEDNGKVIVAKLDNQAVGYVTAEFAPWNKLARIHGLIIHQELRRKKLASKLVTEDENLHGVTYLKLFKWSEV